MKQMLPSENIREVEIHRLIAGVLCLDFANTVNGHSRPEPHEYLHDYQDVVAWGQHAGLLAQDKVNRLVQAGRRNPARAGAVYKQAIRLREVIFRVFSNLTNGMQPYESDLVHLNEARQEALRQSQLVQATEGFAIAWSSEEALDQMLWPISLSATDLLISRQLKSVRQCNGQDCDWLFLDTSRNHMRRWCSMEGCGNRSKMRLRSQRSRSREAR